MTMVRRIGKCGLALCFATALASEKTQDATGCDLAVVGAGIGGAYAAWQASEAGKKVCVFELGDRPGGRIHSLRGQGPQQDLVVEAGAYRFAPHEVCQNVSGEPWCIYTPITAAAVKTLGLDEGIYDPDPKNWDHHMRKLVDNNGQSIGYLTLPEKMLERAKAKGAEVHFRTGVRRLDSTSEPGTTELELTTGRTLRADAVLLNIPQGPLLKLLRVSGKPFSTPFPAPLYVPASFPIMKLYVHYEDAWWRNDLGLISGAFANEGGGSSHVIDMHDVPAQSPAPLKGQYHDGDVRCDGPGGRCRGYLQAFYSGGAAIDYYKNFHPLEGESALQLVPQQSTEHQQLLSEIHAALVALHREALEAANATAKVAAMRPDAGVLSIWTQGVTGIEAGCHVPKKGKHPQPEDLPAAAMRPFPGMRVYVANEAYGTVPCFAEGSLNMSSAALEDLGVPHPSWLASEALGSAVHPPPRMDPFLFREVGPSSSRRPSDLVINIV